VSLHYVLHYVCGDHSSWVWGDQEGQIENGQWVCQWGTSIQSVLFQGWAESICDNRFRIMLD